MIKFNDFNTDYNNIKILVESFDIGTDPVKLTSSQQFFILVDYLMNKPGRSKEEAKQLANKIKNHYSDIEVFKTSTNGIEYIVFLIKEKNSKYYKIHFNKFDEVDNFQNLNVHKAPPLSLFGFILTVLYYRCFLSWKAVKIITPPNRIKQYESWIARILESKNIQYTMNANNDTIKLDPKINENAFTTTKFEENK